MRAAALAALAGVLLGGAGCGSDDGGTGSSRSAGKRFKVVAAPAPRRRVPAFQRTVPGRGYLAAYLRGRHAELRSAPGGRVLARLGNHTGFGSLEVVPVVARRRGGRWLKVMASELGNGRQAWLDARQVWLFRVPWHLDVDLSARRVTVFRDRRNAGAFSVAVGRPGSETPTGHFAVTDKLLLDAGTPYGCCALALTGHQPHVPQGWGGGDRLAFHATDNPSTIGQAASLGCLRASEKIMRKLVYRVQLGARVTIHD